MNKSENFEKEIPRDYVLVKHVDAKSDKKIMTVYTLLSIVPVAILFVFMGIAIFNGYNIFRDWYSLENSFAMLIFCLVLFAYIILHEIVHGITYKCMTGAKLTFGVTLTVAFCGVPDIYVRKKASVSSLIMPFAVFSVIFLGLTAGLWGVSSFYGVLALTAFALHLGGCVGDLHWILMYLTKYRKCNTLMRDTGPEQWLYIPKDEAEKYNIPYIGRILD